MKREKSGHWGKPAEGALKECKGGEEVHNAYQLMQTFWMLMGRWESGKKDTGVHKVDFGTFNSMEGEEDSPQHHFKAELWP